MNVLSSDTLALWAVSPYALAILSLLSFSESAFFIIPPEVLFLPLALAKPELALWYAFVTTITSIAGAIFGYFLGKWGGKRILYRLFSEEKIEKVKILFNKYDAGAMFIAAFTPIPFKVFTVGAGTFDVNFTRMIIASTIGRAARYFLLGGLIFFFGESMRNFIENQFDKLLFLLTVVVVGGFVLWKFTLPWIEKKYLLHETWREKLGRWLRFHRE